MKKILGIIFLSLLIFNYINAEERNIKLNSLFQGFKNDMSKITKITENEIWKI